MAGINVRPAKPLTIALLASYTASDFAMDPMTLNGGDFAAHHDLQPYDYSKTHSFSDLDVSRFDGSAELRYQVTKTFSLRGLYRYVDYQDDAPYLYDTTGTVQVVSGGFGLTF
ncbi:MAG: hypothetical protein IPN83_12785 [Holophagales bacterium]|nr:hypothetical protein [Holophagales bacterium]